MDRNEVLYNCKSLVSTWFYGLDNVTGLYIELSNESDNERVDADFDNCADIIADLLINNKNKYTLLKLNGSVNGEMKNIGSIDIL